MLRFVYSLKNFSHYYVWRLQVSIFCFWPTEHNMMMMILIWLTRCLIITTSFRSSAVDIWMDTSLHILCWLASWVGSVAPPKVYFLEKFFCPKIVFQKNVQNGTGSLPFGHKIEILNTHKLLSGKCAAVCRTVQLFVSL